MTGLRGRQGRLRNLADEELMALVRRQDAEAFATIFDRHAAAAYSLAFRMCGERELAEDVVQETFTALWRGVGSYTEARGSLRSWLLAATRNRMIDAFRARSIRQSADVPDDGLAERLAAPGDTYAEVSARAEARAVRDAIETLPAEQRRVIELAFFGGLSHSQIATMLGLPPGTVKGRMRLGLTKLSIALRPAVGSVV